MSSGIIYALIGVGIASGFGAMGSSFGVGKIAATGAALLSKDPEKYARVLILSALPSTQALYGLLFGFLVLIQTGILAGEPQALPALEGMYYLFAALPVGISGLFSGYFQGVAGAAGIRILAEKPQNLTQAIVLASLIESFAIFGFVISLLIVL